MPLSVVSFYRTLRGRGQYPRRATAGLHLSNPRLRTSGVSPRVKATEGREGFDLGLAFQVPRALARGYLRAEVIGRRRLRSACDFLAIRGPRDTKEWTGILRESPGQRRGSS